MYMSVCVSWYSLALHDHTAFGTILSHGGGVLQYLSPGRLLGDPLEATARAGAFELRPVDAGHRRQGGHVENIADAVLRVLGGALCVRHRSDLPGQGSSLETERERQSRRASSNTFELSSQREREVITRVGVGCF